MSEIRLRHPKYECEDCKPCRFRFNVVTGKGCEFPRDEYAWLSPVEGIPGAAQYCRPKVMWIIEHLIDRDEKTGAYSVLVERWPVKDLPTGYTEAEYTGGGTIGHHAAFEMAGMVAGEVATRLARTGKDGVILFKDARLGTHVEDLGRDARNALNYIAWKRRTDDYLHWLRQKNSRLAKFPGLSKLEVKP